MKRFLMLVAVATVAGAVYATAAPGSAQKAPTAKQFAALKKEVAQLSTEVASQASAISTLQTTLTTVQTTVTNDDGFITGCLIAGGAWPVSEYGDPFGSFGYAYSDDGSTLFLTTALDFDPSNAPEAWLAGVDPSCIIGAARHHGALTVRPHSVHGTGKH